MCKMLLVTTRITLRINFMRLKNRTVKSHTGEKLPCLMPQHWDLLMLRLGGNNTINGNKLWR